MAILIIDDASIMRIVLKDILVRNCGFEKTDIIEASGGIEAISHYKKDKPSLVLCDISMPDMNGAEVVREIIRLDPAAKIIMCTASNNMDDVKECINAGAKDYIVKPPKPERVMQAIEKVLGKRDADGKNPNDANESNHDTAASVMPPSQSKEIETLRVEVNMLKKEVELLKKAVDQLSH